MSRTQKTLNHPTFMTCLLGVSLACAGAACDDEGGGSSDSNTPRKAKRKPVKKKAQVAPVGSYQKVSADLRHEFTSIDFVPDPTGTTNRDPFHSWVLKAEVDTSTDGVKTIDVCTEGKVRWGAPNYSVRDLLLIGLVKRGRSYAQFTDSSESDSWIVRKGDCIGQEKAVIEEIGVGYVRLSITPPAPPGAPAPPAQRQDISLHPDELEIPDAILNADVEK